MAHIFNTLAPIILLVVLGAALRRFRFAGETLFREMNRLVYWVGLPALLFNETANASADLDRAFKMFVVLAAATFAGIALGYIACWIIRLPKESIGAFVQGAYRGNLAYVGLPIVLFALKMPGADAPQGLEGLAVIAIAPLIPIYNIVAVMILAKRTPVSDGSTRISLWKTMATNPLIISCAAGLVVMLAGIELPAFTERSFRAVGQMALPLSLLGIGASLNLQILHGQFGRISAASVIKVAIMPLGGVFVGRYIGLDVAELRTILIFLACPTAVVSYVFTQQMGGDEHLAGGIVVLTTILAMPALAVVLSLT